MIETLKNLNNKAVWKAITFLVLGLAIGLYYSNLNSVCSQKPLVCQNGLVQEKISINSCQYVSCEEMIDEYSMNPSVVAVVKNVTGIDLRFFVVSVLVVVAVWITGRRKNLK